MSNKKHLNSKKWSMSLIGVGCVMATYGSGLVMIRYAPESAAHITNMATQVITFMASLVGAYTIGQSLVDWKAATNTTIATAATSSHSYEEKINKEVKIVEEGVNTDKPKPYNTAATEED